MDSNSLSSYLTKQEHYLPSGLEPGSNAFEFFMSILLEILHSFKTKHLYKATIILILLLMIQMLQITNH